MTFTGRLLYKLKQLLWAGASTCQMQLIVCNLPTPDLRFLAVNLVRYWWLCCRVDTHSDARRFAEWSTRLVKLKAIGGVLRCAMHQLWSSLMVGCSALTVSSRRSVGQQVVTIIGSSTAHSVLLVVFVVVVVVVDVTVLDHDALLAAGRLSSAFQ